MTRQENLLVTTNEECCEVGQAIDKALRFGMNASHPNSPSRTNAMDILFEFYQLSAMIEMLQSEDILPTLSDTHIALIKHEKKQKVAKYMTISEELGCVKPQPPLMQPVSWVTVAKGKEVQTDIIRRMDEFIEEYKRISESSVDHFGGKAEAMDVARRLVNAALNVQNAEIGIVSRNFRISA